MNKKQSTYRSSGGSDYLLNDNEQIDIRQLIEQYLSYWRWFVLAVVCTFLTAFIYLRYTPKQYQSSAEILLKNKSASSPELDVLNEVVGGIVTSNSEVKDQIKIIKSRRLLTKVVEKYNLNEKYYSEGRILDRESMAEQSAVRLFIDNDTIQYTKGFKLNVSIEVKEGNVYKVTESDIIPVGEYSFGQFISTPIGDLRIIANNNVQVKHSYRIEFNSVPSTVDALRKKLTIEPEKDKNSMAVRFDMIDSNPYKSESVINSLIQIYNQDIEQDGEKLAQATSSFINSRLAIIASDLEGVDRDMKQFKSGHQLNNAQAESGMFFTDVMQIDKELVALGAQSQIAEHLAETLDKNTDELLPSSVGIQDPALAATIASYNQLVLEKQGIANIMKENNPMLQVLNQNIQNTRINIQSNLALYQNNLQTQINAIENKRAHSYERLGNMPEQEIGLRKIERQQQIVEAIYLYLLQKREEAEIKSSASIDALKIVDWAHTPQTPVSPKTMIIYLIALVLGLGVPVAVLYAMFLLDNKIKEQKEIKQVYSGAILGEVPKANSNKIVIQQNDRSPLAEAFRILRSNLGFVLPKNEGGKAVYVTSTIAGEGKTFTAINMAQVLSLTGKNVILVGADVRAPKILPYLGVERDHTARGLSDLLANPGLTLDECIIRQPNGYGMDVLFSGTIPPNPAELLSEKRFEMLINELKQQYDFVIVDTAPTGIVSDTRVIADYADLTLYVVRLNYLDKRMLSVLEDIEQHEKLNNLAVIINGVDFNQGYGYGYGYGYGEEGRPKWYQRKSIKSFF